MTSSDKLEPPSIYNAKGAAQQALLNAFVRLPMENKPLPTAELEALLVGAGFKIISDSNGFVGYAHELSRHALVIERAAPESMLVTITVLRFIHESITRTKLRDI